MAKDSYHFCSPSKQSVLAMKQIMSARLIRSVGTNRDYKECLKQFCEFIQENRLGDLNHSTPEIAHKFLTSRSYQVAQKTLDMNRQAIQCFFVSKGTLSPGERLFIVKSKLKTSLEHRAYSPEQVELIANAQRGMNAFSTRLAYSCGLRAHELLTIRHRSEQSPTVRRYDDNDENSPIKSLATKWRGREGEIYTVVGKGGLIREVLIPFQLARELETHRLDCPEEVQDRGVIYQTQYKLSGGQKWSNSFSAASNRVCGWSTGAHGLRHSYAQERMKELEQVCTREIALETVSQEMGHFRPQITEVYLR